MRFDTAHCKGMTALVTGADSGIGLCFSRALASRGVNLIMVSNLRERLEAKAMELYNTYKVRVETHCADLSGAGAVRGLIQAVDADGGDFPDILVNNAGIFDFKPVTEMSLERISLYTSLHVHALTELTWMVADRWKEKGVKGYILNMSSMSCWMPMPGIAMYSATKAYIRVFSRALAYELRDNGIHVMVACPGGIATDLFGLPDNLKRLAVRIKVLQTPEKFAEKCLRRLFRGKMQYINGGLNRISIPIVGAAPTCVRMLVKHRLLDRLSEKP